MKEDNETYHLTIRCGKCKTTYDTTVPDGVDIRPPLIEVSSTCPLCNTHKEDVGVICIQKYQLN